MKGIVVAAALVTAVSVSAREIVPLSGDGWTADGVAVTVPHTWNAEDGADGDPLGRPVVFGGDSIEVDTYAKKAVRYSRALPDPKPGKRYFLKFDGVSVKADVRVNHVRIGTHKGAFTGFTLEATEALCPTGNVLEVVADNAFDPDIPPVNGDFTVFGGVYRDVWLIETDRVCIDPTVYGGPGVRLVPDAGTGRVTAYVTVSGGTNEVQVFDIPDYKLWTPEEPNLYPISVRIAQKGCVDEVTESIGFRTVEFRADGFYLNGVRRKLRGTNRHQDFGERGWAVSAEDDELDIRLHKEMGADAIRTAHYPQSRRVYSLCDRYGLLAWCEIPCLNAVTVSAAYRFNAEQTQREMVAQLGNHPSIAMWSVFNEMYHGRVGARIITPAGAAEPILREINDRFHELDPTRPTAAATNNPDSPALNGFVDAVGINTYPQWYGKAPETRAARLVGGAGSAIHRAMTNHFHRMIGRIGRGSICASEYGAGGSPFKHSVPTERNSSSSSFHADEYQFWVVSQQYRAIADDPGYWGTFLWCFADFAADSRREGDRDGINDKGIFTRDRKERKSIWWLFKANWTDEPTLYLVGSRATEATDAKTDVMGVSNVGAVTLVVNGREIGTQTPDSIRVVTWSGVELAPGRNTVELRADGLTAKAEWIRK